VRGEEQGDASSMARERTLGRPQPWRSGHRALATDGKSSLCRRQRGGSARAPTSAMAAAARSQTVVGGSRPVCPAREAAASSLNSETATEKGWRTVRLAKHYSGSCRAYQAAEFRAISPVRRPDHSNHKSKEIDRHRTKCGRMLVRN